MTRQAITNLFEAAKHVEGGMALIRRFGDELMQERIKLSSSRGKVFTRKTLHKELDGLYLTQCARLKKHSEEREKLYLSYVHAKTALAIALSRAPLGTSFDHL